MGKKYHMLCTNYPWKGYYLASYSTQYFIPFLFNLIKLKCQFNIIDIQIRG